MRVPKSPDVHFLSVTRPFQEDEEAPEWNPPLSEVLIFIAAFAIVTFVLVGTAVVLG